MAERLTVGVLGGLGPAATVDFLDKLVRATPAERDQDHVRTLVDINPAVPCRHAAIAGRGPSAGPELAAMAAGLERAGADFLVMVCNTAHAFEPEIRAAVSVPFVSIVEETVAEALRRVPGLRTAGLLAADGCLEAELYQRAFSERGVETAVLSQDEQVRFMELVASIKAGRRDAAVAEGMRALASELIGRGAEVLVAGCTEIPLVLEARDVQVPLISSTDVLVERTLAYATSEPLPA